MVRGFPVSGAITADDLKARERRSWILGLRRFLAKTIPVETGFVDAG